jgi:maltose O-acetyltransferase
VRSSWARTLRRWTAPGLAPPALEKLRGKLAHNLDQGLAAFLGKGLRFAQRTVRSRVLLRGVTRIGVGVRIHGHGPVITNPAGLIELGNDIVLSSPVTPIHFDLLEGACLRIGDESWLNDGVWVGCSERITIGARALIGPGVRLFDNEYHDLYDRQRLPAARPITLEDDVWIAAGAVILPGVTIGRGAVVGANAVVHGAVAPFTVVAGNPARLVRTLDPTLFVAGGPPR